MRRWQTNQNRLQYKSSERGQQDRLTRTRPTGQNGAEGQSRMVAGGGTEPCERRGNSKPRALGHWRKNAAISLSSAANNMNTSRLKTNENRGGLGIGGGAVIMTGRSIALSFAAPVASVL